jgi:hypothetical protein
MYLTLELSSKQLIIFKKPIDGAGRGFTQFELKKIPDNKIKIS